MKVFIYEAWNKIWNSSRSAISKIRYDNFLKHDSSCNIAANGGRLS